MTSSVAVLIPTCDRPEILEVTLPPWLQAEKVSRVFILAEGSSENITQKYESVLKRFQRSHKLTYSLSSERGGSTKARNTLLDMAAGGKFKYVVMADDDHLLVNEDSINLMVKHLESDEIIGVVGGRIEGVNQRKDDPDFFLNSPLGLADSLTALTDYVFLDIRHGPRYAEALSSFFMMKGILLHQTARYDRVFNTPTGFREESDFQFQIKAAGYKLLFEPNAYVVHLMPGEGGNRPRMTLRERMYWKTRNQTSFVLKWNKSCVKRSLRLIASALILSVYRPWCVVPVFSGIQDGYRCF